MGMLSEALGRNLETVQDQAQGKTDGFSFVMVGPNAPSPKQVDFYKVLVNGKVMDEEYRENLKKGWMVRQKILLRLLFK